MREKFLAIKVNFSVNEFDVRLQPGINAYKSFHILRIKWLVFFLLRLSFTPSRNTEYEYAKLHVSTGQAPGHEFEYDIRAETSWVQWISNSVIIVKYFVAWNIWVWLRAGLWVQVFQLCN